MVTNLNTVLPTYYEFFKQKAALPCISYLETSNIAVADGTHDGGSVRVGRVEFTVKLYTETVADQATYEAQIDTTMLGLGFTRTFSTEMVDGTQLIKVMKFTGTSIEQ